MSSADADGERNRIQRSPEDSQRRGERMLREGRRKNNRSSPADLTPTIPSLSTLAISPSGFGHIDPLFNLNPNKHFLYK
jgi:hypothetical protein